MENAIEPLNEDEDGGLAGGRTRYLCYLWNACVIQWKIYHWQRLYLTGQWRLFRSDNSLVRYVRSTEAHLRMRIEILTIGIYWQFIAIASRIDRDQLYHTQVDTINEQMLRQPTAGEPTRFQLVPSFRGTNRTRIKDIPLVRDRANVGDAFLYEDSIRRRDGK